MKQFIKKLKNVVFHIASFTFRISTRLSNGVKNTIRRVNKYFTSSMEQGFHTVCESPWYFPALFLTENFLIGFLILYCTHNLSYFLPHLICLTLNVSVTIGIGKKYMQTIAFLDIELLINNTSENTEIRILYQRFKERTFYKANTLVCVVVLGIFFWGIISQHYIECNIVGVYAVLVVTFTVSISVIGYMQYLWLLWFLYRTGKCSSMYFNRNAPAHTPFLIEITSLTETAKWCFFLEGFLYVFEYFILIPKDKITLDGIQMPDNTSFLITWFVIFVVIILAFPSIIFIQEKLIAQIVDNLKHQQIKTLSQQFDIISNVEGSSQTAKAFMYNTMINNIIASADYPVKSQRFGPALVSLATLCLHIVTLLTQIPSLNYLVQSIGSWLT